MKTWINSNLSYVPKGFLNYKSFCEHLIKINVNFRACIKTGYINSKVKPPTYFPSRYTGTPSDRDNRVTNTPVEGCQATKMTHHLLLREGVLLICPQAVRPYLWYIPSIEKTHLLPAHFRPAELIKSHSIITDIHKCIHRQGWKSKPVLNSCKKSRSNETYVTVILVDISETSCEFHLKSLILCLQKGGAITRVSSCQSTWQQVGPWGVFIVTEKVMSGE